MITDGLVVFFKKNCASCKVAVPQLRHVTTPMTLVSQDADPGAIADGLDFTYDDGLELSARFGFDTVPAFYLLRAGEVADQFVGWDRQRLNAMLGTDSVPPSDAPDWKPG